MPGVRDPLRTPDTPYPTPERTSLLHTRPSPPPPGSTDLNCRSPGGAFVPRRELECGGLRARRRYAAGDLHTEPQRSVGRDDARPSEADRVARAESPD